MTDPDAKADLDVFAAEVEILKETIIGTSNVGMCFERVPGQRRSNICQCTETWDKGGDITQLVTDAYLARSFTARVSIPNAGGIRIDIQQGDVTINDAYTLLPFANTIVEIDMTGSEIEAILEEAVANFLDNDGSTGSMPFASGLRWNFDLEGAKGSRILNLEIKPKGTDFWGRIDQNQIYKVVANSFIAAGRDGYTTFGSGHQTGYSKHPLFYHRLCPRGLPPPCS